MNIRTHFRLTHDVADDGLPITRVTYLLNGKPSSCSFPEYMTADTVKYEIERRMKETTR